MVRKQVLPLAFRLMDDPKLETRLESHRLLQALYRELGAEVIELAPPSKVQKVADLLDGDH